jgi:hypothetical protein
MRGRLSDRRLRICAIVLCLLAAVFAIEAKVAWFSPAGSPPAQISAAKLLPADAPKHIADTLALPGNLHQVAVLVEVSLLLALVLLIAAALPLRRLSRDGLGIRLFPAFSPALFLRPPPQY